MMEEALSIGWDLDKIQRAERGAGFGVWGIEKENAAYKFVRFRWARGSSSRGYEN